MTGHVRRGQRFRAMGTEWWIGCDRPDWIAPMVRLVHDVEARLSRFRADSALSRLNRDRHVADPLVAQVVAAAVAMREATAGAFDPTLGVQVVHLGYDRDFDEMGEVGTREALPAPCWLEIRVQGDQIVLRGPGEVDLGGVAKGWTADLVHDELMSRGATRVLVDGGGDLRGTGSWRVGVGSGRAIALDGGLATSSTLRRRWRSGEPIVHHLLDPATGRSSTSPIVEAAVYAPDAATADALATALVVAPDQTLATLGDLRASAWLKDDRGDEWTTPTWREIR